MQVKQVRKGEAITTNLVGCCNDNLTDAKFRKAYKPLNFENQIGDYGN